MVSDEYEKVVASNKEAFESLRRLGHVVNAMAVLEIRLGAAIEHLLGEDTPERAEFELDFENKLSVALDAAVKAAQVSKLHLPGRP